MQSYVNIAIGAESPRTTSLTLGSNVPAANLGTAPSVIVTSLEKTSRRTAYRWNGDAGAYALP